MPLFSFGSDPTLDPGRFATFAVPHRELAVGLVAAALVGLPAIASVVLSAGVVVAWSHTLASTAVAVVATGIGLLTRDHDEPVGVRDHDDGPSRAVAAVTSSPCSACCCSSSSDRPSPSWRTSAPACATSSLPLARVVAWSPLGWAWAAPGDVAAGDVGVGLVRLTLAAGLLVVVFRLWSRVLRGEVENPRAVSRSDSGASWATTWDCSLDCPGRLSAPWRRGC